MKNPIKAILHSRTAPGIKIIALSLLLLFVSALPYMVHAMLGPEGSESMLLVLLFAAGALVAHVGFVVGLAWLIWESFVKKR